MLGEPTFKEEALAVLEKAGEIAVPDIFRAEFANVVWKWVQARRLPIEDGLLTLASCEPLVSVVVDGARLWEPALVLAAEKAHSVYDAFYVALARQYGTRVVTYDERLRAKFPADTAAPGAFLKDSRERALPRKRA